MGTPIEVTILRTHEPDAPAVVCCIGVRVDFSRNFETVLMPRDIADVGSREMDFSAPDSPLGHETRSTGPAAVMYAAM